MKGDRPFTYKLGLTYDKTPLAQLCLRECSYNFQIFLE